MKYHNITKDDMLNGDGLRVVLWESGCTHHCEGCQNPCTWNPDVGLEFGDTELKEIAEQLDQDYIAGITFSGGDPIHLANVADTTKIARWVKENYPDKTVWLYTGSTWDEVLDNPACNELLQYVDVLVDGEFIIDLLDTSLLWKGSSNQRVIDVKMTMCKENIYEPVIYCENHADFSGK